MFKKPAINSVDEFISQYPLLWEFMIFDAEGRLHNRYKNKTGLQSAAATEARKIVNDLIILPSTYEEAKPSLCMYEQLPYINVLGRLFKWRWPDDADFRLKHRWYERKQYSTLLEPVKARMEGGYISINRYGALVLNSPNMLIVDVDLDDEQYSIVSDEDLALNTLKATVDYHSSRLSKYLLLSFRVYRTYGGLRLIEQNHSWHIRASGTRKLMGSLYCDPVYTRMCRITNTFRARLSVKPWRGDPETDYVCEYLTTIGTKKSKQWDELITIHDQHTLYKEQFDDSEE